MLCSALPGVYRFVREMAATVQIRGQGSLIDTCGRRGLSGRGNFGQKRLGVSMARQAEDLIYAQTHEQIALEMLIV